METVIRCVSLEDARNRALKKLDELGGHHGPYQRVVIAKNMHGDSPLAGGRVGVEYRKPWVRLRLDFDPTKGPHYNVESTGKESFAYTFSNVAGGVPFHLMADDEREAVKEWMARIGRRLAR